MHQKIKAFLICASACTIMSCAAPREELNPETTSPEALYNHALDLLLKEHEYTLSIKAFDQIDRYYPYSRWALRSQVMLAFVNYKKREYDDAIIVLDRFLQLYPGNTYASYAYYLKALCYYAQISDTKRDQKMTEMALDALTDVIKRFPNTEYAEDSAIKIKLALDYMSGKEVEVARFYQKQNQFISALNRYSDVVQRFQETEHVQEALYRLTETYLTLGLVDQAQKSAAVLGYNYPKSVWYHRAYALMKENAPETVTAN